jgi:hypothetical protein
MRVLTCAQPWATLVATGVARFVPQERPDTWRGMVAIRAADAPDADALERLETDAEFAALMARAGLESVDAVQALPLDAIVGTAVVSDLWSLGALEEVATEEDAILLGDVPDTAVFWEFAEPVPIAPLPDAIERDWLEEADDALRAAIEARAREAGALVDDDGLVYWPMQPSPSLATLVGTDAVGDREITRRVWAYVVEQDLQDPEDASYVYLDDALRDALETDVDGMELAEFTALVSAHIERPA